MIKSNKRDQFGHLYGLDFIVLLFISMINVLPKVIFTTAWEVTAVELNWKISELQNIFKVFNAVMKQLKY